MVFIRHAETDMAGRFCGQVDPDLNDRGRTQLEVLQRQLAPWRTDLVVSSDLLRARKTAEAICSSSSSHIIFRTGLREIGFGQWEGLLWEEIERRDSVLARKWVESFPLEAAPGGEGFEAFQSRVREEFAYLQRLSLEERVIVVTHAGVIRSLLQLSCGLRAEETFRHTKTYASFTVVSNGKLVFSSSEDKNA